MSKTITDSQIIGQLGESIVRQRALKMGFVFQHHGPLEAGIDGILEIRDPVSGSMTGQLVAVQVKTTSQDFAGEAEDGFDYTMRKEDIAYWRDTSIPVIVVLVQSEKETAYWKHVGDGHGPGHRRLRFDKAKDVFDERARENIAKLCVDKGGFGVYFPALNAGEQAHLNLLKVKFPETAYVAFSPHAFGHHALFALLKHEDRPPDDWVVRSRQFMSFRDPRVWPLSEIVDEGTVEPIASQELAFPEDEVQEFVFIELLRRTLASQVEGLLSFDKVHRAFYFPARPPEIEHTYYYKSLKNRAAAKVVVAYRRDGKLNYVRHHAFEPRFWRVEDEWFMSLTPTYHFTWDGVRPDKFASSRLAGKKQRELNSALNGQLAMWRHLLVDDQQKSANGLFAQAGGGVRPPVTFEVLPPLPLARSVPEPMWQTDDTRELDAGLFKENP